MGKLASDMHMVHSNGLYWCVTPYAQVLRIQSNFNGSNTFGTMKISSRQEEFKPMRVDYSARSGGIIG